MARTTDPVLTMLASVDLFGGLSAKDLRLVREQGKEITFDAGDEIAVQGRQGGRFFLVVEGEVAIAVNGQTRSAFGPGSYFGEISLIDGEPRSASAVASTPVRTWTLASFNFGPILREHPSIAAKIMVLLCRRLRACEAAASATAAQAKRPLA